MDANGKALTRGKYVLREVGDEFFKTAKYKVRSTSELPVTTDEAFKAFEDPLAWPKWFHGIREVTWTSPKPFGIGTTRTVSLTNTVLFEHFFHWEQNKRIKFYAKTFTSKPFKLFNALAEDYYLEELSNGHCQFTHTVAFEPSFILWLLWPIVGASTRRFFGGAASGLKEYILSNLKRGNNSPMHDD